MDADNRNDRVREWEEGLPSVAELTPLSQCLISPQLASAFSISSDIPPYHVLADVNKASHSIVAILRGTHTTDKPNPTNPLKPSNHYSANPRNPDKPNPNTDKRSPNHPNYNFNSNEPNYPSPRNPDADHVGVNDDKSQYSLDRGIHMHMPPRREQDHEQDPDQEQEQELDQDQDQEYHLPQPEEVDSSVPDEANPNDDLSARTLKRPRLVWTPELHKRFIEAVGHLGIHNAVPKTIMQLMNVEGLTRENVASHLQKYRLYLKRMQGLSSEGPSSSDYIFASTPMPPGYYGGMEDVMKSSINVLAPQGPVPMVRGSNPTATTIDPYPYNVFAPHPPLQRFIRPEPHHTHDSTRQQQLPNPNPRHVLRSFPTGK